MDDNSLNRPVFIVCLHRTGSTLLKNMLDFSPDLAMATDEMAVYSPWEKCFLDWVKEIGDLQDEDRVDKLVEIIYSGKIYGSFWKDYPHLEISRDAVAPYLRANVSMMQIGSTDGQHRPGVFWFNGPGHFDRRQ